MERRRGVLDSYPPCCVAFVRRYDQDGGERRQRPAHPACEVNASRMEETDCWRVGLSEQKREADADGGISEAGHRSRPQEEENRMARAVRRTQGSSDAPRP